jgi:hypothetical protein
MSLFPLARPEWAQQYARDPRGILTTLLVPLAIAGVALLDGRPERTPAILALGWTLVGLVPPAVRGRTADAGLEMRWRAQPFGAADRWTGAIATHVPVAVVWSLAIAGVAWLAHAPAGMRAPGLFAVAALCGAAAAAWGVALGALSRRPWHRAGLLGFGLALSGWALLPGVTGPATLAIPSGQALAAIAAMPKGLGAAAVPMVEMALSGLVAVIVGVVGYGRR